MMLAKKQVDLLFLTLICIPVAATFLHLSSELPDGHALAQRALTTLVSGPLLGHDLLLVTDDYSQRLLDVGRVVEAAGSSSTPILISNQQALLHTKQPTHHTQGTLLTAILLFHEDPTEFLFLLADNYYWNPSYLVLLCLNQTLNTTSVLSHPVVQRSQYILLLHSVVHLGHSRLYAYGSLPSQLNVQSHSLKTQLGVWNPDKIYTRQSLFPSRFSDFGGQEVNLAAWCIDQPLMYKLDGENCTGQNMDALQIIANKYNFRVSMTEGTDDGLWGHLEDGEWVGLLRELKHFGKDLVINSMILNHATLHAFDYTYPYTISSYGFMIRVPPPVPQWKNILYPFSTMVWGLLFASTLAVAAILSYLLQRLYGVKDPIGFTLKVAGVLVSQAMNDREAQMWWARIWLVFWWVAVDILAAAYTSNLVAVLTVPVFPKVFQTVQELATDDIKIAMLDYGSAIPEFLRTSQNPTMAALGDKLKMIPITNYVHLYQDIMENEMKGGGYALIVFGDYIDYLRQKYNIMKVTYVMKERIYWSSLTWFLRRHTPYTPTISQALSRLQDTGVLQKLYRVHMGKIFGPDTQVRGDGVLNLGHLQGAFILLGLGLVVATLTFLPERLALFSLRPSLDHHTAPFSHSLHPQTLHQKHASEEDETT